MSEGFVEFGMGDGTDDNIGLRSKRFKAEAGRTYRISFAWWALGEDGKPILVLDKEGQPEKPYTVTGFPKFVGANISFIDGAGYIVNTGPEFTKLAGKPPTQRVATVIIVWPLDKSGKLDTARLRDAEVFPWVFAGNKYAQLKGVHAEFPLGTHDVKILCEDTQYQKMSFTPTKDSVLAKLLSNPKTATVVEPLLEEVVAIAENIKDELGREVSLADVKAKLGVSGVSGAGPAPEVDEDVDVLMSNVLED